VAAATVLVLRYWGYRRGGNQGRPSRSGGRSDQLPIAGSRQFLTGQGAHRWPWKV